MEASRTPLEDPSAEEFLGLSTREQLRVLLDAPEARRRVLLRILPPDDAADLIQLAPESDRRAFLSLLDELSLREVKALLAYKEDVAGGLMNPRFARVRPQMTVDEAISYLRHQAGVAESIYYAYALDEEQHLLGVVTFRDLFAADRTREVRDIMRTNFVYAPENEDQEALVRTFRKYHLLAIPVLDTERRMRGVVSIDDIVDVVAQEAGEDIQKIGGTEALDAPYLHVRFPKMVRSRAGWLTILFIGEMFTATAMGYFEDEIARAVVLALFLPLIISSGGNSGSQATTLVIRAMALGELRLRDWWRVIYREASVGIALGAILGAIGLARIFLWQAAWKSYGAHYAVIGLTVACSLVGVVLFGTLTGSMLPFVLRRFGLDPASASAPFVATLVDVTGLVIYFTIASVILRGTLL